MSLATNAVPIILPVSFCVLAQTSDMMEPLAQSFPRGTSSGELGAIMSSQKDCIQYARS